MAWTILTEDEIRSQHMTHRQVLRCISPAYGTAHDAVELAWKRYSAACDAPETERDFPLLMEMQDAACILEDHFTFVSSLANIEFAAHIMAAELADECMCNGVDNCPECNGAGVEYQGEPLPFGGVA